MTSNSKISLNDAITAMEHAYTRLSAATDLAVHERAQSANRQETAQAEISRSWEAHVAQVETTLADVSAENDFLKADNLRLSNQLQQLQQEYLELQSAAGHVATRLDNSVRQLDLVLEH